MYSVNMLEIPSPDALDHSVNSYNTIMSDILNKHAPLKEKVISIKPNAPWYNSDIANAKNKRKKLEHKWLRSKDPNVRSDCHLAYKAQCDYVNKLILDTKKAYYNNKIEATNGNQKDLFKIIEKIFHTRNEPKLPAYESLDELTNRFSDFYINKIASIRSGISSAKTSSSFEWDNKYELHAHQILSEFDATSEDEIHKIVMSFPNKSNALDPLPTWLFKKCSSVLLPFITAVVNMSLTSGYMPNDLKKAVLSPLIKKLFLDPDVLNHFRPISNLSF